MIDQYSINSCRFSLSLIISNISDFFFFFELFLEIKRKNVQKMAGSLFTLVKKKTQKQDSSRTSINYKKTFIHIYCKKTLEYNQYKYRTAFEAISCNSSCWNFEAWRFLWYNRCELNSKHWRTNCKYRQSVSQSVSQYRDRKSVV